MQVPNESEQVMPQPEQDGPVIDRIPARQGVTGHHVWVVLVSTLVLTAIAWVLLEIFAR
jgi:hypothetical protein